MDTIIEEKIWIHCTAKDKEDGVHYYHWAFYHNKLFRVAYKKDNPNVQEIKHKIEEASRLGYLDKEASYPVEGKYVVKEYVDHIALDRNTLILIEVKGRE